MHSAYVHNKEQRFGRASATGHADDRRFPPRRIVVEGGHHADTKIMRRSVQTVVLTALVLLTAGCQSQSDADFAASSPEISPCNRVHQVDLAAGSFDRRTRALTNDSGCFIKADLSSTASIHLAAVSGRLSAAQALSQALAPTHLKVTQHGDTLIVESRSSDAKTTRVAQASS